MSKLDDAALVISAVSRLEESVREILVASLGNRPAVRELVEGDGACASFSSRIKLAAAVGVIKGELYKNLDLARKLRNTVAHCHSVWTLRESPGRDYLDQLFGHDRPRRKSRRLYRQMLADWVLVHAVHLAILKAQMDGFAASGRNWLASGGITEEVIERAGELALRVVLRPRRKIRAK